MKRTIAAIAATVIAMSIGIGAAGATSDFLLTVDGATYSPTKVVGSGPTYHFETPDANPQAASTSRHTWSGHGSENLPCEGGIHWIDNANVLTISHCLEVPTTTTTTEPPTTTTTEPPTTTTTEPPTTTTVPETTTTTEPPETTTTQPEESTTTSAPTVTTTTQPPELPLTGAGETLLALGLIGMALVGLGALALRYGKVT